MIYVLEKGEIVESGTYEKLIEKKGFFYNLERGIQFLWTAMISLFLRLYCNQVEENSCSVSNLVF